MTGHADLVEEAMQALDDGRHLLRQIAGVHGVGIRWRLSQARSSNPPIMDVGRMWLLLASLSAAADKVMIAGQ